MKYETKSIIIGRMKRPSKDDDNYPCFVSLFDMNDPQKTAEVPKEQLIYQDIHKITFEGFNNVNYLLAGNDIVVNDLEYVEIDDQAPHLVIKGKQN